MKSDNLGDRMKEYETVTRTKLIRRTPTIIRLDGKAFHTFTKRHVIKDSITTDPFSEVMYDCMTKTAAYLCKNIQNATLAYTQSDEISILLHDWGTLTTEQWFDAQVQKIVSVSASLATAIFNRLYSKHEIIHDSDNLPVFDARVFNLPKEEVVNYFIWRQQDASRNSVNMLGQHYFSHNELQHKNVGAVQDMLMLEKGVNWNNLDTWKKRGTCVRYSINDKNWYMGWVIDKEIPVFTADRNYIQQLLEQPISEELVKS